MKTKGTSLLTAASLTALLTVGNIAMAQTTDLNDLYEVPTEKAKPSTTKMRLASLKTSHAEAVRKIKEELQKIDVEPDTLTSKATFAAIDQADRDMKRSQSASKLIVTALASELTQIKKSSSFSDEQKQELETAATAMVEECTAITKEADAVILKLRTSYEVFPKWKKVYQSYLNIQGEEQANQQIKNFITDYIEKLTETPPETAPADSSDEEETTE